MEAILIGRSRIEAKVALLKALSSAIAMGTGGPFGAEGPIIATGGAFGSVFAQAFHLSTVERKTLLVAGAAAGMAAIFAAPVAAVMLAVELLLFEWKPRSFIPVACAAAVAGALRVPLLGAGPEFAVVPHGALGAYALHRPDPGLWAMVGMAALMGGTMQVPLTAVVFVLELTGDVTALPGLLVGSIAAAGVTVLLMRRSILTEKLARRGQHVSREYGVNPLHVLRVEEVMEPPLGPPAPAGDVVTYPDELLETAMSKLLEHELEGLVVTSRDDPTRTVGYVERSAILGAWVQLTRDEHTIEQGWLGRLRRVPR